MNNYLNNDNKKVYEMIDEKIRNYEFSSQEELETYLMGLKDRGILTQAQINQRYGEVLKSYNVNGPNNLNTRTPKTMDYAYSNVSEGFTKTGMLVLMAMSVPALIAMLVMLTK